MGRTVASRPRSTGPSNSNPRGSQFDGRSDPNETPIGIFTV
jgi:hypothetical protein